MSVEHRLLLLDQLRESRLLQPAQLDELSRLPEARNPDPRALGRHVLQRGWLTRFQINLIAHGRGEDLHLGPYILLDSLGEGGMGQVFKAQHQRMQRIVALKVIRKEKLGSADAVKRFYQEVQAAAQLTHPNIVIAYDANNVGAVHYLAMEFVDGIDLAHFVKERGPLSVPLACDFIRQAAQGLQHAHERGLVHRDIKPHNLLVAREKQAKPGVAATPTNGAEATRASVVKILDMGLARWQGKGKDEKGVTHAGAVIGTPDYLAPEQAVDARSADVRADLYSLGCTFYYLLTGKPPFQAHSLTDLLLKHQLEQPIPVEQQRPEVPPAVSAVIRKLMAKRPEDRFQTAAEVVTFLNSFRGEATDSASLLLELPRTTGNQAGPWESLTDEAMPWSGAGDPTAVLAGNGQSAGGFGNGQAVLIPLKSKQNRTWMLVAGGFLVAVMTIAAVVFYLMDRGNKTADNSAATNSQNVPVTPKPVVAEKNPEAPRDDQPRPRGDKQPQTGNGEGTIVDVVPHPLPPKAGVTPRWVGEKRKFGKHSNAVAKIAVTADGRTAAVATADNKVQVWNVETGKPRHELTFNFPARIESLALGSNASEIIVIRGGQLHRWKIDNTSVGLQPTVARFLSPDGKMCLAFDATAGKSAARLLDIDRAQELFRFANPPDDITTAVIVPECLRLAVSNDKGEVFLCDWSTLKWRKWRIDNESSLTLALSEEGGHRLVTSGQLSGICVWDADTGKILRRLNGAPVAPGALAISKDGRFVLGGSPEGLIRLWHAGSGNPIQEYEGHRGAVTQIAMLPNGQFLSGGVDRTMRLWDMFPRQTSGNTPQPKPTDPVPAVERPLHALESTQRIAGNALIFTGRADTLLTVGNDGFATWNWAKGQMLAQTPSPGHLMASFALSPNGLLGISAGGKTIRLWDMKTNKMLRDFPKQEATPSVLVFSPDAKKILLGSGRDISPTVITVRPKFPIRVWDAARMHDVCRYEGHTSFLRFAAFLRGGREVLSSAVMQEGGAPVWDSTSGKELRRVARNVQPRTDYLALSPDSQYLLLGANGTARLWDVQEDRQVRELPGHRDPVVLGAFSSDGKYVLTGELHSPAARQELDTINTVHLFEVATGRELRRFTKHPISLHGLAFTPDNRCIVTDYINGAALIWESGLPVAKP